MTEGGLTETRIHVLYDVKSLGFIALITLYQKYLMDLRLYTSPDFLSLAILSMILCL